MKKGGAAGTGGDVAGTRRRENKAACGMHTAPSHSYIPLLARTTLQEDSTTPTRHLGHTPPRVGVFARTHAPPRCPPLCLTHLLLIRYSWLTATVGCGCRCPVMRRSMSCMTWRLMWSSVTWWAPRAVKEGVVEACIIRGEAGRCCHCVVTMGVDVSSSSFSQWWWLARNCRDRSLLSWGLPMSLPPICLPLSKNEPAHISLRGEGHMWVGQWS